MAVSSIYNMIFAVLHNSYLHDLFIASSQYCYRHINIHTNEIILLDMYHVVDIGKTLKASSGIVNVRDLYGVSGITEGQVVMCNIT